MIYFAQFLTNEKAPRHYSSLLIGQDSYKKNRKITLPLLAPSSKNTDSEAADLIDPAVEGSYQESCTVRLFLRLPYKQWFMFNPIQGGGVKRLPVVFMIF